MITHHFHKFIFFLSCSEDFDNKYPSDPTLYNKLLTYRVTLCKYIAKTFTNKIELTDLGCYGNKKNRSNIINTQGVYSENNYPCVLVKFTPSINNRKVPKTFYETYNYLLVAYFIAIVNHNACKNNIPIEMVVRSSFSHNNPSIAITKESFRISIGLVPKEYADIVVESLEQLYKLFLMLERPTTNHPAIDKQLYNTLQSGRKSDFEGNLPKTYWESLWVKGSRGDKGRIMLYEIIERKPDRLELLTDFVLNTIKKHPTGFFTNASIAEKPLKKMFELIEYYPAPDSTKQKPSNKITVNSKDYSPRTQFDFNLQTSSHTLISTYSQSDPEFYNILLNLCNGLGVGLPEDLEISYLYKFLEIAQIEFICKKRTRSQAELSRNSAWGSDSDFEEPNFVGNRSVVAKKVIIANGMLAINLSYYTARMAISFINAVLQRSDDNIDNILDNYENSMGIKLRKRNWLNKQLNNSRNLNVNCKSTYFEVEKCLTLATEPPKINKYEKDKSDILFFDLNHLNSNLVGQQVNLNEQLNNTKPIVAILDHTSSTTKEICKSVKQIFHNHPSVQLVLLVTSGLKNEQGGGDNNPYGKLTILSLSNKEKINTLTNFIYQEITALTSEMGLSTQALLPLKAHAIRRSYKDRGFTTTAQTILKEKIPSTVKLNLRKKQSFKEMDEVTYIINLINISSKYPTSFEKLVKIGKSKREILALYEESVDKFKKVTYMLELIDMIQKYPDSFENFIDDDNHSSFIDSDSDDEITFDGLWKLYDEDRNVIKLINIIKRDPTSFEKLVKIGKSKREILALYEESVDKFNDMAEDSVINLIDSDSDGEVTFDKLSELYDDDTKFFWSLIYYEDIEGLISHGIDDIRKVYDQTLSSRNHSHITDDEESGSDNDDIMGIVHEKLTKYGGCSTHSGTSSDENNSNSSDSNNEEAMLDNDDSNFSENEHYSDESGDNSYG